MRAFTSPKVRGMFQPSFPHTFLRLGAIALLSCFSLSFAGHAKETPPNVILIFVDDMGWMDLTCQG